MTMSNLKPFILVLDDTDQQILLRSIRAALQQDYIIQNVASASGMERLLQNMVPDCLIVDLAAADVISVIEKLYIRSHRHKILGFGSLEAAPSVQNGIKFLSKDLLSNPEILKRTLHEELKSDRNLTN